MVANGEKITCAGVIRNALLLITGATFPADLFIMPLAGYDIILGTKWLGVLGPIVWDLVNRRMSFQCGPALSPGLVWPLQLGWLCAHFWPTNLSWRPSSPCLWTSSPHQLASLPSAPTTTIYY